MKKKDKSKLIFIATFFAGVVVGAGFCFLLFPQLNQDKPVAVLSDNLFGWKYPVAKFPSVGSEDNQLAYSDIRDPGGIPQGLPVRLKIPSISVDSAIEDALITSDGRMDVPSGSKNVAWFALGPHPGQKGSAVIGGHFGINNGVPFVFYNLDKVKVGEKVYIVDDKGDTLAFQVRSIKSFDRNADATPVFTSNDGLAHLNLITCEGIWNQTNDTYPQRLVVFTDSIPSEGAIAVPKAPTITATAPVSSQTLRIGSRGPDVAALQAALEQKGFLMVPRGVVKGYFGALTRAAVAKYQTSVGLPSTGVFNLLTRSKLFPPPLAAKPTLPSTAIPSAAYVSTSERLILSVRSLYATPIDGLITSLLLISIAFTVFKIAKRPRKHSPKAVKI